MSHISIYSTKDSGKYIVYSDHDIFRNKHVLFSHRDCSLKIWLPTLDHQGKVHTTSYVGRTDRFRQFIVTNMDIVPGKYEIDMDESTEDEIIAYLNEYKQ
jgi:hypothetical protein